METGDRHANNSMQQNVASALKNICPEFCGGQRKGF